MARLSHLTLSVFAGALFLLVSTPAFALFWVVKAPILDPRTGTGVEGACGSLIGGKIYVTHGYRGGDSPFVSIYDIGLDTWTHGGPTAPDAPNIQSEMGGATVGGKHYAIGGRTLIIGDTYEFDPAGPTWTAKALMATPVAGAGAAASGGLIYVAGGRTGGSFGSGVIPSFQVYDPVGDTWAILAPPPVSVSDTYSTVAYGGKIIVLGGAIDPLTVSGATQIYDIGSGTWSLGTPMPTPRGASMAGVICDLIAVFGGYDGTSNTSVTELYDPLSDTWIGGPVMPGPVSEVVQGALYDGVSVYSIGTGIFGPAGSPVYELTGDCPSVQVQSNATWGRVKARYR